MKNQKNYNVREKNKTLIALNKHFFVFFLISAQKTNAEGRQNINKIMPTKKHLFTKW